MKRLLKFTFFIVLNFGALGLGTWLMKSGPTSGWYLDLNKAPWTPPGWVFGAAWTSIMLCFSFYMTILIEKINDGFIWRLFFIQWLLNVFWNYLFFNQHFVLFGLINLILLTFLIGFFLLRYSKNIKYYSLLIVPYFLWLLVATSLNVYIFIEN